jgi:hypothetical protein
MHATTVRHAWRRLVGLFVGLLACGCTGTHLQSVEVLPLKPPQVFTKFFVVGVSEDGRMRRLFENAFVAELGRQGVAGVQSYKYLYEERAISAPNIQRAAQEYGADAVIAVRVVDAEGQPMTQRETLESQQPTLVLGRERVSLRVNVFQATTRYLVLSAISNSVGFDSVNTVAYEVCQETVKTLAREHLIAPR